MVNQVETLDRTFAALGDPTRRAIVERLARRSATVGELAGPFAMSLPAVLKHVRVLETAGLVRCDKVGRSRVCRLEPRALKAASSWIERRAATWNRRLDALQTHLEETQ